MFSPLANRNLSPKTIQPFFRRRGPRPEWPGSSRRRESTRATTTLTSTTEMPSQTAQCPVPVPQGSPSSNSIASFHQKFLFFSFFSLQHFFFFFFFLFCSGDFQFFPTRLMDLQQKEIYAHRVRVFLFLDWNS